MIEIRSSTSETMNGDFGAQPRRKGEDNLTWLERAWGKAGDDAMLVLLGGVSTVAFRARVAQSHVRHDMSPSYWSHVVLLGERDDDVAQTPLWEIAFDARNGFGYPPQTNALQEARLEHYRSARDFPNIAVLRVPVKQAQVVQALKRFQTQRSTLDAVEMLTYWLRFLWGAGRAPNPLLEGHGIPSAAMVEVVIGAAGFDLTPGLASRSTSPESIWQSARWWHDYHDAVGKKARLRGAWNTEHRLVPEAHVGPAIELAYDAKGVEAPKLAGAVQEIWDALQTDKALKRSLNELISDPTQLPDANPYVVGASSGALRVTVGGPKEVADVWEKIVVPRLGTKWGIKLKRKKGGK